MKDVRAEIRSGAHTGQTAGLCPGYLQTNIVILPVDHAHDFLEYCLRNPKPCPLVAMGDPGDPTLPRLGDGIDMRHDLPSYAIYRGGRMTGTASDIADLWRDDLVTFALGCSFTFETALRAAGVPMHHIDRKTTVPMFRTDVATLPVGPFEGNLVVSMRPIHREHLESVERICARYPHAHGRPCHQGDPSEIAIVDLGTPDWGQPTPVGSGEVPVFWACGVTSQAAVENATLPLVITHQPGCMLITRATEHEVGLLAEDVG